LWTAQSGLILEPLEAAFASEQSQLIQTLVCPFLLLDIVSHGRFIMSDHRNPIPPCPNVLPHKVPPLASVGPCNVDGTLTFIYPITCDTEYFGGIDSGMCT
jgi:hypothetical protein